MPRKAGLIALPAELLTQILLRVSLQHLLTCKQVCPVEWAHSHRDTDPPPYSIKGLSPPALRHRDVSRTQVQD